MKNNKGFSLVELIVVIAIMAILAAVAIPTFATFITKANKASDVSFVNDAMYAAELAAASSAQKVNGITVKVTNAKKASEITIIIDNGSEADIQITVVPNDANTENWIKNAPAIQGIVDAFLGTFTAEPGTNLFNGAAGMKMVGPTQELLVSGSSLIKM